MSETDWAVMYEIKGPDEVHDFVYAEIFALNCDLKYVNAKKIWVFEEGHPLDGWFYTDPPTPRLTRKEIGQALNEWWDKKHEV